ncbi:hypothetical protein PUN28_001975 [Cardiocondyla obscurior]|uniref:Secreted protein n=1 Tax=Cardiocondyla obscurior TaxID=286306 RepID=A0AAW2GS38_9HYME
MSSTAFAAAVDCASMMTEMLLLLLLEVVVVVEEEMMVVMVVVTVVAVEVVPVGPLGRDCKLRTYVYKFVLLDSIFKCKTITYS